MTFITFLTNFTTLKQPFLNKIYFLRFTLKICCWHLQARLPTPAIFFFIYKTVENRTGHKHSKSGYAFCAVFRWIQYSGVRYSDGDSTLKLGYLSFLSVPFQWKTLIVELGESQPWADQTRQKIIKRCHLWCKNTPQSCNMGRKSLAGHFSIFNITDCSFLLLLM